MQRRDEMESESVSKVNQSVLWWVGHMERINVQHMAQRMMQVGGEYKINWDVVGWMVWNWPWIADDGERWGMVWEG